MRIAGDVVDVVLIVNNVGMWRDAWSRFAWLSLGLIPAKHDSPSGKVQLAAQCSIKLPDMSKKGKASVESHAVVLTTTNVGR